MMNPDSIGDPLPKLSVANHFFYCQFCITKHFSPIIWYMTWIILRFIYMIHQLI